MRRNDASVKENMTKQNMKLAQEIKDGLMWKLEEHT
jgi:hypothetical protein